MKYVTVTTADKHWIRFSGRSVLLHLEISILFIFSVSIARTYTAPINLHNVPATAVPPAYAMAFMKNFGYLDGGTSGAEAQYSQDSMSAAIRSVQKFGSLPQTGVFDNNTLQLMQSRRCGVPDIQRCDSTRRKRFVIGSVGWNKRSITYYIVNWSPKLGEVIVIGELERAFSAWSGYSRLNFKRVDDPSADIIVAFRRGEHSDGYAFDGPGNILAHAFFPYEMGAYGGDVHFDDDEEWRIGNDRSQDGTDFYSVAVHEVGHSLGLSHSPVPSSVMFPYYRGTIPDLQLDYDDILGLYQLYNLQISVVDVYNHMLIIITVSRLFSDENSTTEEPKIFSTEPSTTGREYEIPEIGTDGTMLPSEVEVTTEETYRVTYVGDYETVDDHRRHQATNFNDLPVPPELGIPDICEGNFDAISVFRTELFLFKGEYVWRLNKRGTVQNGYPVKFHHLFWQLPDYVTKIDAAYQRDTDANIVLFSGKQYWVYDGHSFVEDSPRPLSDYGIDESVDVIDAVQVWGKNKKVYLYRGEKFWRFNETSRTLDAGYPHNIKRWRGLPSYIDTAMTWIDGKTYFFKGELFWKFDNLLIRTDNRYPLLASQYWLNCP